MLTGWKAFAENTGYRVADKYIKTRSHTDGFGENNEKCLKPKGICSFVPNSSIVVFNRFLGS